jgi:hypothetical protein
MATIVCIASWFLAMSLARRSKREGHVGYYIV